MNSSLDCIDILRAWLLSRERDIAYGDEDFAELRSVFAEVVGRDARHAPLGVTVSI